MSDVNTLKLLQDNFNIRPVIVSYPSYSNRLATLRTKIVERRRSYYVYLCKLNSTTSEIVNIQNEIIRLRGEEASLIRQMENMTSEEKAYMRTVFYNSSSSKIYLYIDGNWQEVVYRVCKEGEFILTSNGNQYTTFAEANAELNANGNPLILIA